MHTHHHDHPHAPDRPCLLGQVSHTPLVGRHHHHGGHGHDHESVTHAHHAHGHAHGHGHDFGRHDRRILLWSFAITVLMMVVEVVAGFVTGSLALVSDGIHMFTHAFALGLSWGAIVLATRAATPQKSFGFYRLEIVAAFANGLTVLISAGWILFEALGRLYAPHEVSIQTTLMIAIAGLVVNALTGALLMRADQGNLNIKSAFLHMLTDALSSVAIIVGLLVIRVTGWVWIDPLLAALVGLIIVRWSWALLRDSLHVLLEGAPVDAEKVRAHVLAHYSEVRDMHDVHCWQISQRFNCLTAHLTLEEASVKDYPLLVARLAEDLRDHFDIGHVTLQPEWEVVLNGVGKKRLIPICIR
ncbi:MAG: cation transporter [Betaproteobacteria bacterium]|nr:cation transporter [Betaproteobacteria bacterium]